MKIGDDETVGTLLALGSSPVFHFMVMGRSITVGEFLIFRM